MKTTYKEQTQKSRKQRKQQKQPATKHNTDKKSPTNIERRNIQKKYENH